MTLRHSAVQTSFSDSLPGLWSGGGGVLRRSVRVEPGGDGWRIAHSLWEITVPAEIVLAEPDLREFLERSRPAGAVRSRNGGVVRLVQLLLSQGCATYDGSRQAYTLSEIRHLVGALCNRWYGAYYQHPFWTALRQCRLSREQLFAWALRTYHLSRSAGPTAARGALRSSNPLARTAFAKSAAEEYAHCDVFYLPEHPAFGLERAWIAALVPTPSSTAFDQQMAVIAEEDWIAHACAAFFQEYTAAFRVQAFALYDRLEQAYGLTGFFKGWKDHIGYDVDHAHADDFGELFAGDLEIDRENVRHSVANATATVEYLLGALDELSDLPATFDLRSFRLSPAQCATTGGATDLLFGRLGDMGGLLQIDETGALCSALIQALPMTERAHESAGQAGLSVDALAELATRALSMAESHADIILLGRWMEAYVARGGRPEGEWRTLEFNSPGDRALYNFIRENARHSGVALFLFELVETLGASLAPAGTAQGAGRNSTGDLHGLICRRVRPDERVRLLTNGIQWLELFNSGSRWSKLGVDDLLVGH